MSTFYLHPDLGNDAVTATPLGWWSRTYTSGNGTQPTADMQATGGSSGQTAKVTVVVVTSGSWAGGNAAGTIYWYGMSGTFAAETLTFTNGATCSIAGAFTFCAWKTITSGPTTARIGVGDIIRIHKSTDPVKLSGATGQALWTNGSDLVVLSEAQTKDIDMCETAWTAAAGADVTVTRTANTTSSGKQGTYHMRFTFDASVQNSILQAYYPLGSAQDFSAYQDVSYWILTDVNISANNLRIALCSDAAGATPVDYIEFSSDIKANKWVAINTAKTGGGNLGASIQSIAIYTGSSAAALASKNIYIDCIIACKTDGLNLTTLISKNTLSQSTLSSANYGNEPWIAIQSISGTNLYLDRIWTTSPLTVSKADYGGATETVDTYLRKTFKTTPLTSLTSSAATLNDDGNEASPIQYQGGFDMITNLQNGDTIFDGSNFNGYGLNTNSKYWNTINRLSFIRYTIGIRIVGSNAPGVTFDIIPDLGHNYNDGMRDEGSCAGIINTIINASFNDTVGLNLAANFWIIDQIGSLNSNQRGITPGNQTRIRKIGTINQCYQYGLYILGNQNIIDEVVQCDGCDTAGYISGTDNVIKKISVTNSNGTDILSTGSGRNHVIKKLDDDLDIAGSNFAANILGISDRDGQSPIYRSLGHAYTQAATAGGSGKEWVLEPYYVVNAYSSAYRQFTIQIAKFAVASGSQVTISVYMKKSHATNIVAKLVCQGMQISGVDEDVESLCPNDTNRNQVSISFTPTESAVVEIEVSTYAASAGNTVILDDISISQS